MGTIRLTDKYTKTAAQWSHLPLVKEAVAKYGKGTVLLLSEREGLVHLAVAAGLLSDSTFVTVSRPKLWWTDALAEFGRRFRPLNQVPDHDVLVDELPENIFVLDAVLNSHGRRTSRAIVLTDVRNHIKEVLPAISAFVKSDPNWVITMYDTTGVGVIVLSRDPADRPAITHGVKDAFNFFKAELARRAEGGTYLPLPMAQERIDTCLTCVHRGGATGGQCKLCRCWLFQVPEGTWMVAGNPGKVFFPSQSCPIDKWPSRTGQGVVMTADETASMLAEAFHTPETPSPPVDESNSSEG